VIPTLSSSIFKSLVKAVQAGIQMKPRSADDKEYFAQDWFSQRVIEAGFVPHLQGRNSYPDFWVEGNGITEGYEIKALAHLDNGKPARADIDFNSTIPCGIKEGKNVFLVFFLYKGTGSQLRTITSVAMVHGNLINCDEQLPRFHRNESIPEFGPYAQGFIRNRKMYRFPHPFSEDESFLNRLRLVVPSEWSLPLDGLQRTGQITRKIAQEHIVGYEINLYGQEVRILKEGTPEANKTRVFDVFEAV